MARGGDTLGRQIAAGMLGGTACAAIFTVATTGATVVVLLVVLGSTSLENF